MIAASQIRIEKLSIEHTDKIQNFTSYEKELVDFLLEDALDNQNKQISVTFLWFIKSTDELIGYITLLTDRINLSPTLKEEFRKKGVEYKALPAMKIGRVCVDDNHLRKGVGNLMIQFAIHQIKQISKECGCRFITLDAKRNPDKSKDSMRFYKRMDFEILKERSKGTTPMYKDVFKIINGQ